MSNLTESNLARENGGKTKFRLGSISRTKKRSVKQYSNGELVHEEKEGELS